MSPTHDSEDSEVEKRASPNEKEKEPTSATSTKPAAKRRTKTGCLTCRKRRIKCGEEKPFCKNCIKSKRDCAGYVQPLVYKEHNHGLHSAGRDAVDRGSFGERDQFQFNAPDVHTSQAGFFNPFAYAGYHNDAHARHVSLPSSQGFQYPPPEAGSSYILQSPIPLTESYRRHSMQHHPSQHPYALSELQVHTQSGDQPWSLRSQQSSVSETATHPYGEPPSNLTSPYEIYPQSHGGAPGYFPYDANPLHETHLRRYSVHGFLQASPFGATVPTLASPPVALVRKEEENDDSDDYDDMETEESLDLAELGHGREQQFAELLGRSQKHPTPGAKQRARVPKSRALQTTHHPMILSPLQDERNERLFCHFVEVTGRCMTLFERPAADTWSLPPRTLWSYTLPSAAMSHPALAHAMLALSGLHVAKLQQSSEDPSLKHFTYALRRVGNLLGLPKRRHEITTLATVLLLGFYEVLAADHSRWNLHLTGATRLVLEHDYAAMIRTARRMRNHAKGNISQFSERSALTEENYLAVAGIPESLLDDEEWEVDQDLISTLTGQEVNYDQQIQPNFAGSKVLDDFSDKDVAEVKIKMDLRWWYCKQDVFQSMISGDPLLMDYDQWKFCPPRGRIGNANMPYGTFDHLLLILGRLSNFGGKDRSRKQRVVASQGGQWRPPPGLFPSGPPPTAPPSWNANTAGHPASASMASAQGLSPTTTKTEDVPKPSPAPSANEGRVRQSKPGPVGPQAPSGGPLFHGMMPPPPVAPKMHSSFYAMNEKLQGKYAPHVKSALDEEPPTRPDLKHETDQAVAEHTAIAKAFDVFVNSLGPDFEPLVNDGSFPHSSPFGPPLRYQSPAIAAIWLHYYVGRILLHRLHPHMPPAAMIAASVTAHLTREHAQNVGKAAAGLYATSLGGPGDPLDPMYAGALIESTFPLLFAAVQFQDASQRGWTISKLHDIARMSGWQTSGAVAGACEIAWERMGQAGKGPPYIRSLDRGNRDARVNGTWTKVDARSTGDYAGPTDTGAEEESQFVSHDRALIGEHGPTRVHWALGLLSVEEDIKKLDIGK